LTTDSSGGSDLQETRGLFLVTTIRGSECTASLLAGPAAPGAKSPREQNCYYLIKPVPKRLTPLARRGPANREAVLFLGLPIEAIYVLFKAFYTIQKRSKTKFFAQSYFSKKIISSR